MCGDANGKRPLIAWLQKYNKYGKTFSFKRPHKNYCSTKYSIFGRRYEAPYQKDYDKSKLRDIQNIMRSEVQNVMTSKRSRESV